MHPEQDYLLILRHEAPTQTPGGIAIPNAKARILPMGTILDVGPTVTKYKKGEHVVCSILEGVELALPSQSGRDQLYLFLREGDVIGRIIEEPLVPAQQEEGSAGSDSVNIADSLGNQPTLFDKED